MVSPQSSILSESREREYKESSSSIEPLLHLEGRQCLLPLEFSHPVRKGPSESERRELSLLTRLTRKAKVTLRWLSEGRCHGGQPMMIVLV
jgi:hypothetical protein